MPPTSPPPPGAFPPPWERAQPAVQPGSPPGRTPFQKAMGSGAEAEAFSREKAFARAKEISQGGMDTLSALELKTRQLEQQYEKLLAERERRAAAAEEGTPYKAPYAEESGEGDEYGEEEDGDDWDGEDVWEEEEDDGEELDPVDISGFEDLTKEAEKVKRPVGRPRKVPGEIGPSRGPRKRQPSLTAEQSAEHEWIKRRAQGKSQGITTAKPGEDICGALLSAKAQSKYGRKFCTMPPNKRYAGRCRWHKGRERADHTAEGLLSNTRDAMDAYQSGGRAVEAEPSAAEHTLNGQPLADFSAADFSNKSAEEIVEAAKQKVNGARGKPAFKPYGAQREAVNPVNALLSLLYEAHGNVEYLRDAINASESLVIAGKAEREEVAKLVVLYNEERDRLEKYTLDALKHGLEQRQMRLYEIQAQAIVFVLKRVFEAIPLAQQVKDAMALEASEALRQFISVSQSNPWRGPLVQAREAALIPVDAG